MSVTTWIEATLANVAPLGIVTSRWNGSQSVVCWKHESRIVLLGESNMQGSKRAIYEVINNPRVIAQLRKLDAEAARDENIKALAEMDAIIAAANELGIALDDNDGEWVDEDGIAVDAFQPTVEDERMAKLAAQG